jgi:hypothetical protein
MTRNWGMRLLGGWLIITGLIPLLHIRFPELQVILDLLAVVAGILILLDR